MKHTQRNIKHKHTTQRYQLSTGTSCDSLKKEREEHKIPSRPETQQIRKGCVLLNLCLFLGCCFTSKTQTGFLDFEDPRRMTCQQRQQNLLQLALTSCCRNITSFTFASTQGTLQETMRTWTLVVPPGNRLFNFVQPPQLFHRFARW